MALNSCLACTAVLYVYMCGCGSNHQWDTDSPNMGESYFSLRHRVRKQRPVANVVSFCPKQRQHVMMSCHAECGALAHWNPVPTVIYTIREHHFGLWSTSGSSKEACSPRQEARFQWLGPKHKGKAESEKLHHRRSPDFATP